VPPSLVARARLGSRRPEGATEFPSRAGGWGKPNQPHAGEDGDVSVTLRTITDGKP
jgi:hypothetical protein